MTTNQIEKALTSLGAFSKEKAVTYGDVALHLGVDAQDRDSVVKLKRLCVKSDRVRKDTRDDIVILWRSE